MFCKFASLSKILKLSRLLKFNNLFIAVNFSAPKGLDVSFIFEIILRYHFFLIIIIENTFYPFYLFLFIIA